VSPISSPANDWSSFDNWQEKSRPLRMHFSRQIHTCHYAIMQSEKKLSTDSGRFITESIYRLQSSGVGLKDPCRDLAFALQNWRTHFTSKDAPETNPDIVKKKNLNLKNLCVAALFMKHGNQRSFEDTININSRLSHGNVLV
jgi:hypothetical protein